MIEAKDLQMIDAYKDGKLSDTERLAFEDEMRSNPEIGYFLRLGEDIQKILRLFLKTPSMEENAR